MMQRALRGALFFFKILLKFRFYTQCDNTPQRYDFTVNSPFCRFSVPNSSINMGI